MEAKQFEERKLGWKEARTDEVSVIALDWTIVEGDEQDEELRSFANETRTWKTVLPVVYRIDEVSFSEARQYANVACGSGESKRKPWPARRR